MEQKTREEIAAAAAVHGELGPGFDDAVAEGLVERIGAEVDKRVDARLAQRGRGGQVSPSGRPPWSVVVLGLGSMTIGGLTAAGLLSNHSSNGLIVIAIWIVIGAINVAYARRR
jgi:hypothetical protein